MNINGLIKVKIMVSRAGGYAGLGSFLILVWMYVIRSDFNPILMAGIIGILMATFVVIDYKWIFPMENRISAMKSPWNVELVENIKAIMETQEDILMRLDYAKNKQNKKIHHGD